MTTTDPMHDHLAGVLCADLTARGYHVSDWIYKTNSTAVLRYWLIQPQPELNLKGTYDIRRTTPTLA